MAEEKDKAGFICVKDTLDGAYPSPWCWGSTLRARVWRVRFSTHLWG